MNSSKTSDAADNTLILGWNNCVKSSPKNISIFLPTDNNIALPILTYAKDHGIKRSAKPKLLPLRLSHGGWDEVQAPWVRCCFYFIIRPLFWRHLEIAQIHAWLLSSLRHGETARLHYTFLCHFATPPIHNICLGYQQSDSVSNIYIRRCYYVFPYRKFRCINSISNILRRTHRRF